MPILKREGRIFAVALTGIKALRFAMPIMFVVSMSLVPSMFVNAVACVAFQLASAAPYR